MVNEVRKSQSLLDNTLETVRTPPYDLQLLQKSSLEMLSLLAYLPKG